MEHLKPLWDAALDRQPESVVTPCMCGRIPCGRTPAPKTNISGDERRRCWPCYRSEFSAVMDHGRD
jgi:hypothetical protein